ncbi:MAG: transglutaminase domain-containing protein [Nanoarchaeota archaeon]|nr:transglutaminase domain-containing protein [Nanoarchaeota archaeon]
MKWLIVFILVLLVLINSINVNAEDWQYTAETMEASIDISSGVNIIPDDSSWEVRDLIIRLGLWPRQTDYQNVVYQTEDPEAEIIDGKFVFELEDVEETDIDVVINGIVEVSENRPHVKKKVNFPVSGLGNDFNDYIESTENINTENDAVIELTSTIVEGEDDLFKAVYLVGEWVKENIEYKLDEYTEADVQGSDWVFENRYGACDEISNMFIAMVRSLGVPARYVGGYAFTDIDGIERFESHAWSEVYFPNYGWVPYDMTYGQFGFVDISHINLGERLCSSESAVEIELTGRDVSINGKGIDVEASVNDLKGSVSSNVAIEVEFAKDEVDVGSYNLIRANVKNERDYYIALPIYVSNNVKVEMFDGNIKYVVLKPNEEKILYWKIKISEDLKSGYYYTLPFNVYSLDGEEVEISLLVEEGEYYLSEGDVDSMIAELQEEKSKSYSSDVEISCKVVDMAYTYETIEVSCMVRNTGNKFLGDLEFCDVDCELFDLGIGQEKSFSYSVQVSDNMKVSISNNDVSRVEYLDVEVLDIPEIKVVDLTYPESVSYEEELILEFGLQKESNSIPKNVIVDIGGKVNEFTLDELNALQVFKIKLKGANLDEGENNFNINVEFEDLNKRKYAISETVSLTLNDVSFGQKIMIWLNGINNWFNGL